MSPTKGTKAVLRNLPTQKKDWLLQSSPNTWDRFHKCLNKPSSFIGPYEWDAFYLKE